MRGGLIIKYTLFIVEGISKSVKIRLSTEIRSILYFCMLNFLYILVQFNVMSHSVNQMPFKVSLTVRYIFVHCRFMSLFAKNLLG